MGCAGSRWATRCSASPKLTVQLARLRGATVIGLAGERHHAWLHRRGIIPIDYSRPDLAEAIRSTSGRVDAFLDTFGDGDVELALHLGVRPERINTTIDFAAADRYGVRAAGESEASTTEVLAELADLLDTGRLELPVTSYPLDQVRYAYRDVERRHTHGKLVLVP
jgi:NADPH:quinone reductase-like Zn-dependent oxidoreductase